jgi:hypothetical protein
MRQMDSSNLVLDWTTDFDYLAPQWIEDPYPIWDDLRAKCPIAHSERYMGTYLPTRYADIRAIALDTEHFSSRRTVLREGRPQAEVQWSRGPVRGPRQLNLVFGSRVGDMRYPAFPGGLRGTLRTGEIRRHGPYGERTMSPYLSIKKAS